MKQIKLSGMRAAVQFIIAAPYAMRKRVVMRKPVLSFGISSKMPQRLITSSQLSAEFERSGADVSLFLRVYTQRRIVEEKTDYSYASLKLIKNFKRSYS